MSSSRLLVKLRMATSIDDVKSIFFWRAVIAELVGTLLLVFVGCGSCLNWDDPNKPPTNYNPVVQIAFCFGLSVATIVWAIGHVSGGHINPAVTAGFFITRRISLAKAIFYIAAQSIGAILGALILKGVTPADRWGALGTTGLHKDMEGGRAFGVEFMITFVLVFTVFASCDGKRDDLKGSAPLTIGLSVTMCHLFAIPLTGSSMNSARSFGPAVAMDMWENHWVYWVGPVLGGSVAGLLYENIFAANASVNKIMEFLLASKYDTESFPAQEQKIRIIADSDESDIFNKTEEHVPMFTCDKQLQDKSQNC